MSESVSVEDDSGASMFCSSIHILGTAAAADESMIIPEEYRINHVVSSFALTLLLTNVHGHMYSSAAF